MKYLGKLIFSAFITAIICGFISNFAYAATFNPNDIIDDLIFC